MRRLRGFTLVELMIVVTIIGVLAVIAGTAYRKYTDSGRTAEVMAMFGEFRTKEEAYRAENSVYVSTTTVGETDFYPALLASGEPKAKTITPLPTAWQTLGINPARTQLYCGYVAIAGPANAWSFPSQIAAGAYGQNMLSQPGAPGTPPAVPWWYVHATCNNDGNPTVNATWTTASTTSSIYEDNQHK
jgi:prepilin-type N-terminal cleavage/methylation domain-containing protein